MSEVDTESEGESVEEGMLLDCITNGQVKDTPKEHVRQRIARALWQQYGLSVDDMVPDFKLVVEGKRKAIDIAIFAPGSEKTPANLRRIVICDKEPKVGTKGAYVLLSHRDPA